MTKTKTKPNRFRFRAWDTEAKRMVHSMSISAGGIPNINSIPNHTAILMQSTGLADSEGVEIFEGDVVKAGFDSWTEEGKFVVEWSDREAILTIDTHNGVGYADVVKECSLGWWVRCSDSPPVRVIGNKYEHGHLLGKSG